MLAVGSHQREIRAIQWKIPMNEHSSRLLKIIVTVPFGAALASCALVVPQTYTSPKEVTLPTAMASIVCSLKTYQNENQRLNTQNSMIVDQVDVTLNLKASATGKSDLAIDVKPDVAAFGTLGFSYKDSLEQLGYRDNQIKITLKSLYTITPNKPGENTIKKAGLKLNTKASQESPVKEPCRDRRLDVIDNSSDPKSIPE